MSLCVVPPSPGYIAKALLTHQEGWSESIADYRAPVRCIPNQFQFPLRSRKCISACVQRFFSFLSLLMIRAIWLLLLYWIFSGAVSGLQDLSSRVVFSQDASGTSSQFLARWCMRGALLVSSKIYRSGSAVHVLTPCNLSLSPRTSILPAVHLSVRLTLFFMMRIETRVSEATARATEQRSF